MTTIPVQTRLDSALAKALDARAAETNTTRAEVVRTMLEAALAAPQPAQAPTTCGFRHHRDHDSSMMAISVPT